MPVTRVRLFREEDGSTPFLEWLATVENRDRKAYEKCRSYLQRLAEFGRELRRPTADYLRDGVYELRIKHSRVNYRVFYGFVGKDIVLVTHGTTKEKKVPAKEIDLAALRIAKFRKDPKKYCTDTGSIESRSAKQSKGGFRMSRNENQNEGKPVEPELQQIYDYVTTVIANAHDEPLGSPQYEKMVNLFSVLRLALIESGAIPVIDPENVPDPDQHGTINPALLPQHSNALQLWYDFYLAAITNVCPD